MNSKQERLKTAFLEYQKIKDAALISYTEILDIAHTAYRKIKDEIEAEPDELKSDLVQVTDGKLTYHNTPQICHICKEEIQHGDEIEFDSPTQFSINDIVHKSCKILSSEPKEQL